MTAPLATYTVVDADDDEVLDVAVMVMTYVLSTVRAYAGRENLEGSRLIVFRARFTPLDLTVHVYFTAATAAVDEHADTEAAERIESGWDANMLWYRGPMMLREGRFLSAVWTTIKVLEELKPKKFVRTRVKVYVAFIILELSTVIG